MADPAMEAAQALGPLLAVGVDGALAEVRRQADAGAAAAVRRVIDQIRGRSEDAPSEAEAADALREALAQGGLTQADLEEAVRITQRIDYGDIQVGRNAYIDSEIRVDGGGSFHG
jgi:hypothetical protein